MKTSEISKNISYGILGLYTIYGIFAIPFAFFLLSIAIGLIVYGAAESLELTTASVLITGVLAVLISRYYVGARKEGFMGDNPVIISKRLASVKRTQEKAPIGVYATGYVEAFEDISKENPKPNDPAEEKEEEKGESPLSKPAEVKPPTPIEKQGFKDTAEPEGLFKLGVIPQDTKGGFHIDQGTTVLNALNALQPDQVKKMSEDTQKLIDTQKSLMSMLGTMKPMLSDGKQLIDTFQQMFGPQPMGGGVPVNTTIPKQ